MASEENAAEKESRGMARCAGFQASDVVPRTDKMESLEKVKAHRAQQREVLKTLTKTVKTERRRMDKVKKKALALSNEALCDIIGMKQHLAQQWEAKKAAAEAAEQAASEAAGSEAPKKTE